MSSNPVDTAAPTTTREAPEPQPGPGTARGASPAPLAELAWTSEPGTARGPRGRGSASNPVGRFERLSYLADPAALEADRLEREENGEAAPSPRTLYLNDPSKSAIAKNSSPDLGFDASLNPYRGCEHGCSYCYARPTHEYLGFSAGLDFETRILVKQDMPALLRKELCGRRWTPQVIAMSGVTDPYQPVERRLEITRRCLGVLLEFRNPVVIVTKNALVARDADRLATLLKHDAIYTMPPLAQWYAGRESIRAFFAWAWPAYSDIRMKEIRANGEPGFAAYFRSRSSPMAPLAAHSLHVVSVDADGISRMTLFVGGNVTRLFDAFGLPTTITDAASPTLS